MGSTLEHGIYLPSEGEKNCYQGLAGNWNKVDGALGDIAELKQSIESKFTKEIVTELPTEDINPFCIYMILKTDPETDNIYDEWVYINNAWEYLGNTQVDMTQYYTKQEVNELPAVASGVTSTKVGNYDTHLADSNIHVTASDKTKWTNSANTVVLRLAKTALTPSSSTNAFSNLDDATALKVGDKVMDTAGVLFEVTAIDTANSTFTIGTALVDLAQDSDVVHKSENETISGDKVFNDRLIKNIDVVLGTTPSTGKYGRIEIADNNKNSLFQVLGGVYDTGNSYARFFVQNKTADDGSGLSPTGTLRGCGFNINLPATSTLEGQGSITPRANQATDLGLVSYQWRNVWCKQLYLNGTQLDPSAFALDNAVMHLSGNETVGGNKTFSSDITLQGTTTPVIKTISNIIQDSTGGNESISWVIRDKTDSNTVFSQTLSKFSGQSVDWRWEATSILNGTSTTKGINLVVDPVNESYRFTSRGNNTLDLGASGNRWKSVYATNYYYGSNNVEFSTKFVTTDTAQTITGSKTFSEDIVINNSDTSQPTKRLVITSSKVNLGDSNSDSWGISFNAGSSYSALINSKKSTSSTQDLQFTVRTKDTNNALITADYRLRVYTDGTATIEPTVTDYISLGSSANKWKDVQTKLINGLTPSSLSMPDLNSAVDISGYLTNAGTTTPSEYTPSINGWMCIGISADSPPALRVFTDSGFDAYSYTERSEVGGAGGIYTRYGSISVPVVAGVTYKIIVMPSTVAIITAKLFPCLGNV